MFVALLLGGTSPALAQAPQGEEKPPETPDWTSLLGLDRPASGPTRYDNEKTPEGWAWARIRRDEIADLNLRCDPTGKTHLDSRVDAGWDDSCRKIPAAFVSDVLTIPRLRDRIGRHGLRVQGARIEGDPDLGNASIGVDVGIEASRIEGTFSLTGAHLAGALSLRGTQLRGDFAADRVRVDAGLLLRDRATFKANVRLAGARVGGAAELDNSTFERAVIAANLSVQTDLFMRNGATFNGPVTLTGAKVGDVLDLDGSVFEEGFGADGATIGQWVFARGARFFGPVHLVSTHIAGGLDLGGSVATRIDLTNASIADDLILGDRGAQLQWQCAGPAAGGAGRDTSSPGTSWPLGDPGWRRATCGTGEDDRIPAMTLRNTRVGTLQDSLGSWPPNLVLEGFKYDRLGGSGAAGMRKRTAEQWRDWLDRDRSASRQPSMQLASVLLASGHRATAASILYFDQERERREAIDDGDWYMGTWLTVLWAVAGYGIGMYSFRILYWIGGLTLLGTVVLLFAAKARRHGILWCFGASLQRLLPVVEFNRNVRNFFDNPPPTGSEDTRNLNGFQAFFFSLLALAGWLLGFVLLAAVVNLTPAF